MGKEARARGIVRRLIAVVVLAIVVSPAVTARDSFPISTYPMYSFERDRVHRFPALLAMSLEGDLSAIPMSVAARTDDLLVAQALILDSIRGGRAERLCESVLGRIGDEVAAVLVVEELHDVIAAAARRPSLDRRIVHATCGAE